MSPARVARRGAALVQQTTQTLDCHPDPTDRRAKLIVLTPRGRDCIAAGMATIDGIEQKLTGAVG